MFYDPAGKPINVASLRRSRQYYNLTILCHEGARQAGRNAVLVLLDRSSCLSVSRSVFSQIHGHLHPGRAVMRLPMSINDYCVPNIHTACTTYRYICLELYSSILPIPTMHFVVPSSIFQGVRLPHQDLRGTQTSRQEKQGNRTSVLNHRLPRRLC